MAFEHKPGTFSLFRNEKGGNEKRPDYRGTGKDLAGREIEVAGWIKDGAKAKFMSCVFKLKEKETQPPAATAPIKKGGAFDDMESDIPF